MAIQLEERRLVRRLLHGDERAFNQFFDDHFPRLYRFALPRLGGDEAATEEVVSDALSKALAGIGQWRGESALFTWLCTICRREVADWMRRNGRHVEHLVLTEDLPEVRAAVESLEAHGEQGPAAVAQRAELGRLIQVALDALPPRYGNALEWKYIEGHPVRVIAQRLGISQEAAQSLLARARRAFADAYASLSRPVMKGTGP